MKSEYRNRAEYAELSRQQRVRAKHALWQGRMAFLRGQSDSENPFMGWQHTAMTVHSFQCLLWCRWMYGWLVEYQKKQDQN